MTDTIEYRNVSRETWTQFETLIKNHKERLTTYLDQLLWWNQKVNLVSRNASRSLVWKHITHSLLPRVLNLLPEQLLTIDIGTGGGLPGIPLSISSPSHNFLLNDINFKKIAAVRQIIDHMGLSNATTHRGSFETIQPDKPYTLISKHSFKLEQLQSKLQPGSSCKQIILYKGKDFEEEIRKLDIPLHFTAFQLDTNQDDPFFKEKYLLRLTHKA